MIPAAEINKITKEKEIEIVFNKIIAASEQGKYQCVTGQAGDHVFEALKEAGYTVTEISRAETVLFDWKISWA